jgi:ferritin-like metal-binding protein YciE
MESMVDLMGMTLQELYNAENQMLGAAPTLMAAASSPQLAEMLERHARTTEEQIRRLEKVMPKYGGNVGHSSQAMAALLAEAKRIAQMPGEPDVKDAALIMAQQRVEHDEIACYGTAVSMLKLLGDEESARLLAQTLDEEEKTDKALSQLAKRYINPAADEAAPSH